ncbi:MAG TPA: ATP-binding protein [Polyangia bacterium]
MPATQDTDGVGGRSRVLGARFRLGRLLKVGQGVESWLADDLDQSAAAVVKLVSAAAVPPSVQHRVERESRALREVCAPRLTPIVQVGCEAGLLYVARAFVPGVTLDERLRRGALGVPECVTVGISLLAALDCAHAHGVLHRDVKPTNLVLSEDAAARRATLIDFGLSRVDRLEASIREQPLGAVRRMSPEQAGLIHADVREASDLYAAGLVLYECLAGRPCFDGRSITEVLRQQLSLRPPDLRSLGLAVPRPLDELIHRLLHKDPRDRYQSAAGALADLDRIGAGLARGEAEPEVVIGACDERRTLTEPAFIGRTAQLATLRAEVERARRGAGRLVLLEAESGGGKTRLLDELAYGVGASAWVLRSSAVANVAPRPFLVLDGLVDEIITAADAEPALGAAIRERVGDQGGAICAALPRLEAVLGPPAPAAPGPEAFAEARTGYALAVLLEALGSDTRPAVVLLDDGQWADAATVRLVRLWHDRRRETLAHVGVVVAFRGEEAPADLPLREVPGAAHLPLPALDPTQIRQLAESMAGPLPDDAAAVVARLAEGSPFMASAVLRGLVESGALVRQGPGWHVDPGVMAAVRSSHEAALFLTRRLDLLPPPALALLSVAALLGREFDLDFAAQLAGQTAGEAADAIGEARRRHILWAKGRGAACAFVHDKLRDALLARLSDEARRALHRRAAAAIEERDPGRVFDLAYHFDAAGAPARALPYALAAGDRARARHALELAEQQYRIAERSSAVADPATRGRVAEALGEVLMLRGRYGEALVALGLARSLARGRLDEARVESKLGALAFNRGEMRAACEAFERALRLLGRHVPGGWLSLRAMLGRELVEQVLHTVRPARCLGVRGPADETELLAMRLYEQLARAYWFRRGVVPSAWAHLYGMNLAEHYTPSAELAQIYSAHAPIVSSVPLFDRALAYAERSLAQRTAAGDLWGQGQTLAFYGVTLYAASRYEEALEKLGRATQILERTGDLWHMNVARGHTAYSLYRLGRLAEGAGLARRLHQHSLEVGDVQLSGHALDMWAKASLGRIPREAALAELARDSDDAHTRVLVLQADAVRLLHEGRPAEAAAQLEAAQRLVDAASMRREYVAPILPWLATARRQELETTSPYAARRRTALLAQAQAAADRGLRVARRFRNNLPHALREAGLLAAAAGDPRRARALLGESVATAERQGARHERALTLEARGRAGLALGWPGAAGDAAAGAAERGVLEAGLEPERRDGAAEPPVTISVLQRFDTLLDVGRQIASALTRDAVLSAVRRAALTLLRGEHCVILEPGPADSLVPLGGGDQVPFSAPVAARALASGRPIVVGEDRPAVDGLARSVLAAPILVRGRAAACLYLTHERVGGLFGAEEERLGEFIAALAGAALENAEGFAAVQALSDERSRLYREAQDAVRARDEFLSIAAHELRTPLMALTLPIQTLQRLADRGAESLASSLVMPSLRIVDRQARRLTKLVNSLLDVSRITAGRLTLEVDEVDLADVTRGIVDELHEELVRAGCPIELRAAAPVVGRWDRLRLEQVVTNLVSNAIKFGAGRPIEIAVEGTGGEASLTVRDHGIGIPPDDLSRIFERFERAVSMSHYAGFGLGLWIVRQVVQASGGTVQVTSSPAEGSVFTVTLPRGGPAAAAAAAAGRDRGEATLGLSDPR